MKFLLTLAVICLLSFEANAQSGAYGQCGGQGWGGASTCISGYTCVFSNPYYSQCLPGTATVSTPQSTTTVTSVSTTNNGGGTTPTASTTATGASPTGSQIRSVQAPVYHFYLQDSGGIAVLGPEASAGLFTIGGTISLNQAGNSKLYLNIDNSGTASFKALTFGATATTTDWGLEGDTIITTNPRQLNFIACSTSSSTIYTLYLQTGNDTPSGTSCTLQTIHLPCLC